MCPRQTIALRWSGRGRSAYGGFSRQGARAGLARAHVCACAGDRYVSEMAKSRTAWVLVADDDSGIRESLRLILEDAGYRVVEAVDGVQTLEVLRESSRPMVVLLDLMMPKVDGAGVLGAVAADPKLASHHCFILMTATHKTIGLAFARLLSELEVPVLPKPFELDAVLAMVERGVGRLAGV